jgi:hypothetical protein
MRRNASYLPVLPPYRNKHVKGERPPRVLILRRLATPRQLRTRGQWEHGCPNSPPTSDPGIDSRQSILGWSFNSKYWTGTHTCGAGNEPGKIMGKARRARRAGGEHRGPEAGRTARQSRRRLQAVDIYSWDGSFKAISQHIQELHRKAIWQMTRTCFDEILSTRTERIPER